MVGPEMLQELHRELKTIMQHMRTTQEWQRVCANHTCSEATFVLEDLVFLKVSPTKGNMRFKKCGKLSLK